MKQSILITGASGFLGRHIVEAALQKGLDVHIGVRPSSDIQHFKNTPLSVVNLDYQNIESLKKEIESKQYSYIIHAAGITKAKDAASYNTINAQYTFNLAKAAKTANNNLKKFVFISSLAAVGPLQNLENTITETTPPQPVTAYGQSKLLAEEMLLKINIPSIIFRPTAIYGPADKELLVLFKMIAGGYEFYIGKKNQQLSFIYATDMAEIIMQSLPLSQTGIYNISDGGQYNRYQFATLIKEKLQKKTIKIHVPLGAINFFVSAFQSYNKLLNKVSMINKEKIKELSAANWICAIDKAQQDLNFCPQYNLQKGINESIDWYKKNKWL